MTYRLALKGAPGSPYTRKMLAVLRYRHIPYALLVDDKSLEGLPVPKVSLLPTCYFPNAAGELEAVIDSTPIIRRLEREHAERSVIPGHPALALLNDLLEDYADEWLTKAMFHYRWSYAADIELSGQILPRWRNLQASDQEIVPLSKLFRDRQIARLGFVGSNEVTAPTIEASYRRLLKLLRNHLPNGPYLLGNRPGSADFAFFGQLTQLTHFDPTPQALTLEIAPQVYAWVDRLEDLSGLVPTADDWFDIDQLPDTLTSLLAEVGRVYVPLLLANNTAVTQGLQMVETTIDGAPWRQAPFPYQVKCLASLRQSWANLSEQGRSSLQPLLVKTGCDLLF